MKKLLLLIAAVSTVLFSFAMEQDLTLPLREQQDVVDKSLYDGTVKGDIVTVEELLKAGASLNRKDSKSGQTPLHVACEKNHDKIVALLLDNGALVNETDSKGQMPLHWSVKEGNFAIVNLLLEHGANVNHKDSNSRTPLHLARWNGHPDMVKLLLEKGALVDEPDRRGETPLHWAARDGNLAIANVLLEYGANVNCKSKSQQTPLYVACQESNSDMVKLLLEKGALVDQTDRWGQPLLHLAVLDGNFAIVNLLLERGANVNERGANVHNGEDTSNLGATPLHIACRKGNLDMVKLLLGKSALVDQTDLNGSTPLHYAAYEGNFAIANFLLECSANVNSKSESQETPLHMACGQNHSDMVKLLLEKGALVDETNLNGWTPLHSAVWRKNYFAHENFVTVDLLLEHGANILAKDKDGRTVIDFLGKAPARVRAMKLLKHGAPYPTTSSYEKMMWIYEVESELTLSTPFYRAYFKALIKDNTQGALAAIAQASGNDLNKATKQMKGLTALHWAVVRNNREVVEALVAKPTTLQSIAPQLPTIIPWYVSNPVDINCRDINGRTPLMWAARLGYIDIYRILARAGAKGAYVDRKGKMALNYAADYRNIDIIREMIIDGTLSAKPVINSN